MIGIILVHGKAQTVLERNITTFHNWCDDYEFICPADDPITGYNNVFLRGKSQHNGLDTVERMRYACERASMHENAVVLEYDTLLFKKPPTAKGNELHTCGPFPDSNTRFKSNWWSHSPWLTTRENFYELSQCPLIELEEFFPDRWMAAACDRLGIVPVGLSNWFSRNSIDTPEIEKAAIDAKKKQAVAIHGVKTEKIFNLLYYA